MQVQQGTADGAAAPVNLAGEPRFELVDLEDAPATREVITAGEQKILQPRTMQVPVALARQRARGHEPLPRSVVY